MRNRAQLKIINPACREGVRHSSRGVKTFSSPYFSSETRTYQVLQGQSVTLHCSVKDLGQYLNIISSIQLPMSQHSVDTYHSIDVDTYQSLRSLHLSLSATHHYFSPSLPPYKPFLLYGTLNLLGFNRVGFHFPAILIKGSWIAIEQERNRTKS